MESAALAVIRDPVQAVALLQPERLKLLEALGAPDSASGLARRFELPRQRLNYHLKELEKAGLVELVEERRKGNCVERVVRATARSYVISPEALGDLGTVHASDAPADRLSAAYLITAAARTLRDVAALDARAKRDGKRIATLTVDADIRFASAETRAAFAEDLANTIAALVAKYHDDRTPNGRRFRLLAAIHPAGTTP
jgi:DNA-binding transcriptional ArsR family regulator